MTSGTSGGLMLALSVLVNPGDEVLYFDPYFVMYKHLTTLVGGKPVPVDTYPDFRIDLDKVRAAITERTKVILCNSPANPTGTVLRDDELEGLAQLAAEKDVALISDEIYRTLLLRPPVHEPCPLERTHDRHRRLQQIAFDDGMAAGLRPRPGRDHPADDQAAAVHLRLRAAARAMGRRGRLRH